MEKPSGGWLGRGPWTNALVGFRPPGGFGSSEYIRLRSPLQRTRTSAEPAMRTTTRTMTKRKRRTRKRRGIIRRRIPRALVPTSKIVRLKMVKAFTFACTSGALEAKSVKMFGFDDAWKALGSEQPLGYDGYKIFYRKGVSLGVQVLARIHNKGSAAIMCGITPMPESQADNGLTSFQHYMELPATRTRLLSPDVDHGIVACKVGTARHVGVKKLRDEDAFHVDLPNETTSTRDAYITTWAQPIDATTTNAVEVVITVEYLVLLFDYIVPARSTDT